MNTRTVGWVTLFLIGTDLFVISPLLPGIRVSMDVDVSTAAWTVTLFSLAYIVGGPVFGGVADRIGHRRVLMTALGLFACANLLTALAQGFAVLLVARAAAGLAASGVTPTVYALIGASAPAGQRARWLATVTSGLLLALAIGAPAGSLLAATVGWHAVFAILAVAAVVVFVLVAAVTEAARQHEQVGREAVTSSGATEPDPTPGLLVRLRAVGVTGLWALAVYGLYTYLGTILTTTQHLRSSTVAVGLVCYGLGAVVGNLAGGWLSDRHTPRHVSALGMVALAAVQILFGLTIHAPTALVFVLLGAFALSGYQFFPAQQARLVGGFATAAGAVLAWNSSAMYVGILLGSLLGGPVLTTFGVSALAYGAAAIALAGAFTASTRIAGEQVVGGRRTAQFKS